MPWVVCRSLERSASPTRPRSCSSDINIYNIQSFDSSDQTIMSSSPASDLQPPSTTSIIIGTAIIGVALGYFIGQGASLGIFGSTPPPSKGKSKSKNAKKSWPNSYDVTVHPDSSDEEVFKQIRGADLGIESEESSEDTSSDEAEAGDQLGQKQEGLNQFEENREECKLVLVVRTDLGMGKGTPSPTAYLLPKNTYSKDTLPTTSLTMIQARSQPNVPTQPSPATAPSPPIFHPHSTLYLNDGRGWAKQRSCSKPKMKRK